MDQGISEDAYRRAAEMVPVRVDRHMRDILYGDVPTFMELPHARRPVDLEGAGAAFLGKGFDLCCLGPQYDDRVGTGSHLAARLFVEVLAAMAWRRAGGTAPAP